MCAREIYTVVMRKKASQSEERTAGAACTGAVVHIAKSAASRALTAWSVCSHFEPTVNRFLLIIATVDGNSNFIQQLRCQDTD